MGFYKNFSKNKCKRKAFTKYAKKYGEDGSSAEIDEQIQRIKDNCTASVLLPTPRSRR